MISELAKKVSRFTLDHSPAILTAVGVVGSVTTAYLTGKASFRAAQILREEEYAAGLNAEEFTLREKVEQVWRLYVPAVGTGVMTVTCIIAANRIGSRRAAALASAYMISEQAFDTYKEKVIEKLGPKKEQAVRDEIAQDLVCDHPVATSEVVILQGDVLFMDSYSKRYFRSDVETVKHAQNAVNYMINHDGYASLTDLYNQIGLSSLPSSNEVGWNADRMLEIEFSTAMESNQPCIVMGFSVEPVRSYYRQ